MEPVNLNEKCLISLGCTSIGMRNGGRGFDSEKEAFLSFIFLVDESSCLRFAVQGFYHELHRPSHFLNFTSMEDVDQAAEADHEDFFQ